MMIRTIGFGSDQILPNKAVIAGPGAGKTELLAQRACFLLQTGKCPPPRKILAISFKRDSANTLRDRVQKRCGAELATRFDSFTFDAFSKSILDRFSRALPDCWQPADYIITYPKPIEIEAFLDEIMAQENKGWSNSLGARPKANVFINEYVVGFPLPERGLQPADIWERAAEIWWKRSLRGVDNRSRLSFPMIGRLAELILRANPKINAALQATYSNVFMDEFQDTTGIQYALVQTAFQNSSTILTAVGDKKQQIMRWAGALEDVFERFKSDFSAQCHPLISNYRSSPELVAIQHTIAKAIDDSYVAAESKTSSTFSSEPCVIYEYETPKQEAKHIADIISHSITMRGLAINDFAFIVRQRPQDYVDCLSTALNVKNIKVRNEADLQDLLAERLTKTLIPFMRLGMSERSGELWQKCLDLVQYVRRTDLESDIEQISKELAEVHSRLYSSMRLPHPSVDEISRIVRLIIDFLGVENIRSIWREYGQGNYFQELVDSLIRNLEISFQSNDTWVEAVNDFEGIDSIPVLTIHKSKGLEYDTVVFIGLDDQAWWSFPSQPEESKSAFFVAFSRAKQRVIFTYCQGRGGQIKIASLYDLLRSSGVETIKIVESA